MPKFAYTVVITDADQRPYEYSDIMDAISVEHVVILLASKGYLIREVRVADEDDLRLHRLKQLRDKLSGKKVSTRVYDITNPLEPRRSKWKPILIMMLIAVMLIVIYILVNGSQ